MPDLNVALPDLNALKTFLQEGSAPFVEDIASISDATLTRNLAEGYERFSAFTGWDPIEASASDSVRYYDPSPMSNDGWYIMLGGGLVEAPTSVRLFHDRATADSGRALTRHVEYDLVPFGVDDSAPFYMLRLKRNPGGDFQSIRVEGKFGYVANGGEVPARMASAILRYAAAAVLKDSMGPGGTPMEVRQGPVSLKYESGSGIRALTDQAGADALAYRII